MKTIRKKNNVATRSPGAREAADRGKEPLSLADRLGTARIIMLVCLLAFAAYANSLGGDFVFDDTEQIVENQDLRSWNNVARGFTTDVWAFREKGDDVNVPAPLPYYRPLFTAMLTVEYKLFGLRPQLWHLVSLLLHVSCSIQVFYIILSLSRRKSVAMVGSLLFAVHPVHAESVSWISGMTDPLFGVFFLAAFYFYLKQREQGTSAPQRRKHLAIAILFFIIAAFAKETALSLVILIFGYEIVVSNASAKDRASEAVKRVMPFVAAAMIYLVPRFLVLGERMLSNPQAPERPLSYTLLTLPFVVCSYLLHLVWPVGLSVTYDTRFITTPASAAFLLPAVVLALAAGLVIRFRAKISREVWAALLLIFVPLLPVLNLGQISQEQYLVFDHYLYISVAGLGYLLGLALERFAEWQTEKLGGAVAAMVVIALTVATHFENRAWANSYEVWSNAARVSPNYWAPQYNTALELIKVKQFDEARGRLERAASLKPDEPMIFDALGRAHLGSGDLEAAQANIKRALELNPEMFESLNNLGSVYFEKRDYVNAEKYFTEALRANPQASATRYNLARCYGRAGQYEKAAREFEQVLRSSPNDAETYYELGLVYGRMGRDSDSVRAFEQGLTLAESQELAEQIRKSLREVKR